MSVVVAAHQVSASARLILEEAAREAGLRHASLSVIHIAEGVDVDLVKEEKVRLRSEIAGILAAAEFADVEWNLQVATGADVAQSVLEFVEDSDVELLVIGARRRSAVGKLIMGSVTQTILLRADVPVLVVKAPAQK